MTVLGTFKLISNLYCAVLGFVFISVLKYSLVSYSSIIACMKFLSPPFTLHFSNSIQYIICIANTLHFSYSVHEVCKSTIHGSFHSGVLDKRNVSLE